MFSDGIENPTDFYSFIRWVVFRQLADLRRRADDSLWFLGVYVFKDFFCQKNKDFTCNTIKYFG